MLRLNKMIFKPNLQKKPLRVYLLFCLSFQMDLSHTKGTKVCIDAFHRSNCLRVVKHRMDPPPVSTDLIFFNLIMVFKWPIQHFQWIVLPKGRGANLLFLAILSCKLHEIEKKWTRGNARLQYPLDAPLFVDDPSSEKSWTPAPPWFLCISFNFKTKFLNSIEQLSSIDELKVLWPQSKVSVRISHSMRRLRFEQL